MKYCPKRIFAIFTFLIFFITASDASALRKIKKVTLSTDSGVEFNAYLAGPKSSDAGILLAHDWFGDSAFYRRAIRCLANQGYRVLAIDYYNGQSAKTHDEAGRLLGALDKTLATEKARAGYDFLAKKHTKLASLGFSAGTEFAFLAARGRDDVLAMALWYGYMPNSNDASVLTSDTLVVIGSLDGNAAERGAAYSQAMDENGRLGEFYLYPFAHHAFAQPLFNAGATFNPEGARASWAVTNSFLRRKLK